ncbi:S41 family peptidase [Kribbella sp. VKM Ac-2566]|uniref:S41 family peptidase n=1 Tax=Kribbella sp. VKM Ac-2566 TaxID=2512218 RepID=UPI001062C845|nr:S41 family peptidase [Kribbella sp. VKM Ac-2566]TDX03076.1 peptidase S41-like protein [Kribbella sp. VKM Ac-2566]
MSQPRTTKRQASKTAASKTAAKKTAAKKTAAKKSAPNKTAARKTATKKTAAKKTAAKRTTAGKTAARRPAVRETVTDAAAAVPLADFLDAAGTLTLDQRKLLVDQALLLLSENYVHLPLKVAMHAVNPLQRLRVMRARMERQTAETMQAEWLFHREMSSIFHSVRDLHTNYLLPAPFAGKIAFLPFMIEKCHDADGPDSSEHYLITRTITGYQAPQFGPGAEVTHWNGTPIARAVALNGAVFAGSNEAANLARGLESLTLRPLVIQAPPDEDWVTLTYVGLDGSEQELREQWKVTTNLPPMTDLDAISEASALMGLDLDSDEKSRAKKALYVRDVVELERGQSSAELAAPAAVTGADLPTTMPGVFRAREVVTTSGTFGHLRIFTFSVQDPVAFRDEFVRLAAALPQNGLIVDVRDNGGGHIYASEFTLQTMTPRRVAPEPVQFISSPLNLRICRRHQDNPAGIDLGPWFDSLDLAIETGAQYSAAKPITPEDGANDIGQTYHGPVVLITDARVYSATDIFAAGFADHEIGTILGVDDNTGAGGANVWTHGLLAALLNEPPPPDETSPYVALPNGANLRVAIRRTLRVGKLAGTPVEDLGVKPQETHRMTRADLLEGNVDLLNKAGELLAALPVRRLDLKTSFSGTTLTVAIDALGIDRVDLYVEGRPISSEDYTAPVSIDILDVTPGQLLRADGYDAGDLVASRRQVV